MVVETYEVEEVEKQTVEQCDEAMALVEQLGLVGQAKIYAAQNSESEVRTFPYRKMTAQEMWVYGRVLPAKTKLGDYSDQAIPLRVLQVAAHVASLVCDRSDCTLFVWHPRNADYKDPLLVLREGQEYGANSHYLLARWGDELEEFGVLAEKAKAIYRSECLAGLAEEISKLQGYVASVDTKVQEHFLKGSTGSIGSYWH